MVLPSKTSHYGDLRGRTTWNQSLQAGRELDVAKMWDKAERQPQRMLGVFLKVSYFGSHTKLLVLRDGPLGLTMPS